MNSQLNLRHAEVSQEGLAATAARRRRGHGPILWTGLTLRLATSADQPALERLAELDDTTRPAEPILLGEIRRRPVAALSLADGRVIADPFTSTYELVELLRLRARQMGVGDSGQERRHAIPALLARVARARPAASAPRRAATPSGVGEGGGR